MKETPKGDQKKSAIDPTDPRQAAFVSGGITGAVAGAALGSPAGPVGAVVGAAIGGLAGAKTAEHISIDTAAEDTFWRKNWRHQPYASPEATYDDFAPAYKAGYGLSGDMYANSDASFEESEPTLRKNYEGFEGSKLPWDKARPAARDAFERVIAARKHDE